MEDRFPGDGMDDFPPLSGAEVGQLRELLSGQDTHLHSHQFDRSATHDTVNALQDSEGARKLIGNTTLTPDDDYLLIDTTGGAVILSLPRARGGKSYCIVRIAGAAAVTLSPSSGDTINGLSSGTISSNYAPFRIKAFKGIGWIQI